jgi:cytochrome c553
MARRLFFTLFVCSTVTASAATSTDDPQRLACQACHLSDNAASAAPHLAGQREGYLVKQLKAFHAGDRKDELMNVVAGQLSEADIERLARFWSKEAPGSDNVKPPAAVAAARNTKMTFPRDFPKGFVVYSSSLSAEEHMLGTSYANAAAVEAVRAGKPLPDGATIIVSTSSVKLDDKQQALQTPDGGYVVDQVLAYSGMEARTGWGKDIPELLRNGTWNYGLFSPDKQAREFNQAACLACHKPVANQSFVFTLEKLKAAVAASAAKKG